MCSLHLEAVECHRFEGYLLNTNSNHDHTPVTSLHDPKLGSPHHSIWRNEVQKDQETWPHIQQAAEAGPQPGFP